MTFFYVKLIIFTYAEVPVVALPAKNAPSCVRGCDKNFHFSKPCTSLHMASRIPHNTLDLKVSYAYMVMVSDRSLPFNFLRPCLTKHANLIKGAPKKGKMRLF